MAELGRPALLRTPSERQLCTRHARLLRRLAPAAALAATGLTYGLHHTALLDDHDVGLALVLLTAGIATAFVFSALAATPEAQLPVVLTLDTDRADVRPARTSDLVFCATLQRETLPHGFFAALGQRFLRAYLATFVTSPYAVAILLTVRDTPLGMVVGVIRPRTHRSWVLAHNGPQLAVLGAAALAARPRLALRFLRTRSIHYARSWRRRRSPAALRPVEQPAVLSHVAVVPGAKGSGFGRELVAAFVEAAREGGSPRVVLATLAGDAGAAGFYRKTGWLESGTSVSFDGQRMVHFSLPLSPEQ